MYTVVDTISVTRFFTYILWSTRLGFIPRFAINTQKVIEFFLCFSLLKLPLLIMQYSLVKLFNAAKMVTSFNSCQCIVFIHSLNSMEFASCVSLSSSECISPMDRATRLSRNTAKCIETVSFLLVSSNYFSLCET